MPVGNPLQDAILFHRKRIILCTKDHKCRPAGSEYFRLEPTFPVGPTYLPSRHQIKLVEPRYEEMTTSMTIEAGKTATVTQTMKLLPEPKRPFGVLRTKSADKFAAVYLNDKYCGHGYEFDNHWQGEAGGRRIHRAHRAGERNAGVPESHDRREQDDRRAIKRRRYCRSNTWTVWARAPLGAVASDSAVSTLPFPDSVNLPDDIGRLGPCKSTR